MERRTLTLDDVAYIVARSYDGADQGSVLMVARAGTAAAERFGVVEVGTARELYRLYDRIHQRRRRSASAEKQSADRQRAV